MSKWAYMLLAKLDKQFGVQDQGGVWRGMCGVSKRAPSRCTTRFFCGRLDVSARQAILGFNTWIKFHFPSALILSGTNFPTSLPLTTHFGDYLPVSLILLVRLKSMLRLLINKNAFTRWRVSGNHEAVDNRATPAPGDSISRTFQTDSDLELC